MRLTKRTGEKPGLWQRIKDIAFADVNVMIAGLDEGSLEKIEETLLAADFGVPATLQLVDVVESRSRAGKIRTEQEFRDTVQREVLAILRAGSVDGSLRFAAAPPTVYLMVGVNGVGKTTTIGKLAHRLKRERRRVLLAAADTFRAGAIDQLRIWAERTGSDFVGAKPGADPASVAFDAIDAAEARGADVVIIDTAGRLHTQDDLMTELAKIGRVVDRRLPGAPHETLLVLDATVGQNAVAQTRTFRQALPLTGLVLAKLDSTARGGIVVALKKEFDLPVKLVGTGEAVDALVEFDAEQFSRDVLET
ncbi:MAG TPA: signal recognition particle-docking protein FtsY [Longimicrobiales bacterium]|nr:signal recognition particle-docking protein FtsY [Longimicrobiales bacterium]